MFAVLVSGLLSVSLSPVKEVSERLTWFCLAQEPWRWGEQPVFAALVLGLLSVRLPPTKLGMRRLTLFLALQQGLEKGLLSARV